MNLITLENISKSYSETILLDNISLGINTGDKIGLIGLNGSGKSTLLKIITGRDEFFNGNITKGKDVRIEYLGQDTKFDENSTIIDQIFNGDSLEMKLLKEYESLVDYLNNHEFDADIKDKLIKLQDKIDSLNLWSLESEAMTI